MDYVLYTKNLTKVFGKQMAVDHVSMNVKKGDIYGFIGKNGAGKTTFMRMVAGLAAPTGGTMELFGSTQLEKHRVRIGSLIENPGIYAHMTARDNLEVARRALGIPDKQVVDDLLTLVGISNTEHKKVKNFSMGMKQRLGIAFALLRNPDFLILDEPINGLDPTGIREIRELLLKLNHDREITIMISSHILGELSKIATRYGIIRDGALIEEFPANELEERCRRCHKLVVDDVERASHILEQKLGITNFDVLDQRTLRIFEQLDSTQTTNRTLITSGIELMESYITGQDLESYFMDLLGGEAHV